MTENLRKKYETMLKSVSSCYIMDDEDRTLVVDFGRIANREDIDAILEVYDVEYTIERDEENSLRGFFYIDALEKREKDG